jgi:hypothetical protein
VVHVDNEPEDFAICDGTVHGAPLDTLRDFFLVAAGSDLRLTAAWLGTAENQLAVAFSRFHYSHVTNMVPQLSSRLPLDGQSL